MDDEPLEAWAERRSRRLRAVGTLRAVIIGMPAGTAGHLLPAEPRAIEEWDGYQWSPVALADNYASACRYLDPDKNAERVARENAAEEAALSWTRFRRGTGRHRKPEPDEQP